MNEQGGKGDAFWRRKKRQMPERGNGDGDPKDSRPHKLFAKEVGQNDSDVRRTLRGIDVSGSEEITKGGLENAKETTIAERHPDWPEINVTLVLGPHRTAADGEPLKQYVSQSDVCFFEDSGGYPSVNEWQEFADMNPTHENTERVNNFIETRVFAGGNLPLKGSYYESVVRSLFEAPKKVIVGHIDLLHDDPVEGSKITEELDKPYCEPSFEKTLDNLQDKYKKISEMQEERERIMTRRLETQLEEIFDDNPELKERPLEIMISLGDRHRSLAEKLEGEGVQSRKEFTIDEKSVSPQDTIQHMFARGEEPSRDLLARTILENILDGALNAFMETPPEHAEDIRYKQMVSNQFTTAEIKEFYERVTNGAGRLTLGSLNRLLRDKGIPSLPSTKAKLEAAIEKLTAIDDLRQDG